MDIQYIKEKIRNVVLNVKNGYMFRATNLEGEIDGMLYVCIKGNSPENVMVCCIK